MDLLAGLLQLSSSALQLAETQARVAGEFEWPESTLHWVVCLLVLTQSFTLW